MSDSARIVEPPKLGLIVGLYEGAAWFEGAEWTVTGSGILQVSRDGKPFFVVAPGSWRFIEADRPEPPRVEPPPPKLRSVG